ncbi:hypothetical protein JX266_012998 [Neoarthrinium moseri]|nr:hypothetical protein JX266_012998 [Neoarthrinium moseri]
MSFHAISSVQATLDEGRRALTHRIIGEGAHSHFPNCMGHHLRPSQSALSLLSTLLFGAEATINTNHDEEEEEEQVDGGDVDYASLVLPPLRQGKGVVATSMDGDETSRLYHRKQDYQGVTDQVPWEQQPINPGPTPEFDPLVPLVPTPGLMPPPSPRPRPRTTFLQRPPRAYRLQFTYPYPARQRLPRQSMSISRQNVGLRHGSSPLRYSVLAEDAGDSM